MPELPEVEVVRRGLERHVVGRTITEVEVLHPRPVRRHLAGPGSFRDLLVGRQVTGARRRGKFLWLPLDSGDALMAHLGMSGQMLVQPSDAPDEPHLRVRFGLTAPAAEPAGTAPPTEAVPPTELRFVDQRMFGGLWLSAGGAETPSEIVHIALDPLDDAFDDRRFIAEVRRRRSAVKRILLDQKVVSGVGNIYADEALWGAGVNGERPGDRLTSAQVRRILSEVRAVMAAALRQGGTSFDALYVNVNGESGYFDRSLSAYGQEGLPCSRCGTPIRRVSFMNRSSYFCPRCQPVPRARRKAPVTRD